jgi:hypothetical protein
VQWLCRLRVRRNHLNRAWWIVRGLEQLVVVGPNALVVAYRYTYVGASSRGQGRRRWDPKWIPKEWVALELPWVDGV